MKKKARGGVKKKKEQNAFRFGGGVKRFVDLPAEESWGKKRAICAAANFMEDEREFGTRKKHVSLSKEKAKAADFYHRGGGEGPRKKEKDRDIFF